MKDWLTRIKAAAGMGLTWAVAWAPLGILIGLVFGGNSATPDAFPADDWLVPFTLFGFIGGGIFSGVLRLTEGRRRFDQLSLPRFAAWGALGGLLLGGLAVTAWLFDPGWGPVLLSRALTIIGATTLMGGLSASGTLAIARRGQDRELSEADDDLQVGPASAASSRELPGHG